MRAVEPATLWSRRDPFIALRRNTQYRQRDPVINMTRLKPLLARCTTATLLLFLSACSGKTVRRPAPPVPGPAFDSRFLQDRAHHSRETIGLTEGCAARASRAEMQPFCQQLRSDAQQEINIVAKLRAAMSVDSKSTDESDEHESELFRTFQKRMAAAAGPAYDNALLRALRQHYREGSDEATSCSTVTLNTEIKTFCMTLSKREEQVLRQINAYICNWFKDCSDR